MKEIFELNSFAAHGRETPTLWRIEAEADTKAVYKLSTTFARVCKS